VLDEGALVGLSALNGDPGPRRRYVQLQLPAAPPTTESLPVQIKALMRGSGGAPAGRWHDIERKRVVCRLSRGLPVDYEIMVAL
jgi:hypothetical protein